jgi:mono/diheme cytochrome c family protein/glucose/arabinose dehydrogenase
MNPAKLLTRWLPALAAAALTFNSTAQEWLHLPAKAGTANGKKIVLVSGDEEYRSEESCPMLAKILSQRFGFDCTVLFAINPEGSYVDPNFQNNIPGTEALKSADLLIIGTRFRQLPDAQLANFADYLNAGKPVMGFRTATHAFTGSAKTGDFAWANFGLNILGEKWISHHGQHGSQGTRGMVEAANAKHAVLADVGEIFGPSDVYGVVNLDPKAATILLRGAVTETLEPDSKNLDGPKNTPMMALAWLREYTAPNGTAKGKAFCTTMGASTDFADEDLRRLFVNVSHHMVGLPVPVKADVSYIDPITPSKFQFIKDKAHFKTLNLKPADYGLGKSPATLPVKDGAEKKNDAADKKVALAGKRANATTIAAPAAAAAGASAATTAPNASHAPIVEPPAATSARAQAVAAPANGERIVFLGNGLAERDLYYSRFETELQLRFPDKQLFVRNMGRPGDTPAFRPHPSRKSQWAFPGADKFRPEFQAHAGEGFFPTPDQWLHFLKADTIVAFFGYNESFDGPSRVANYEAELDAFVVHTLSKAYNGKAAPRLVLVSPIAFENQSTLHDLPTGDKENANLALYTAAMERVAQKHKLTFVDLFNPTKALYANAKKPFTNKGFIPTNEGYQALAPILANGLYGKTSRTSKADPLKVLAAVKQKDWLWNHDYNILNGVHAFGRRYAPFGPQNYPDEGKKNREMAALRDQLILDVASGKTTNLKVDDSKTHALPPVPTNYRPGGKNGTAEYLYGKDAEKTLTVPEGYKVELFASEKEFPNLANPMQLSFDNKGRLWVAVMPTYPHYRAGDAMPNDKLLIYEDTNGDGKADKETVFADKLHLPIGFEFAPEGVYVSEEPNIVLLRDTNGDDKADVREIVLGGFDSHDTHHAISAYTADPSGAFVMGEGVFLHTNVETPYGAVRGVNGGFWRYSPQRSMLERTAQVSIPNPWGIVFDEWGQDFFLHTSGPTMNWMMPSSVKPKYGATTPLTKDLIPEGQRVRPTSGLEVVSSRHFPDEVQGDLILCNAIGFLGIKQHSIKDEGTGYKTTFRHELLKSSDGNFRPADLEFAPDGSLYVIDWHNVLIGHMQHNARDPLRDHVHGRIYRITYPSRPLVKPAKIDGAPIATLLENLKLPENRSRYRTRRALRDFPIAKVMPALKSWVAKLDKNDPRYEHHVLEALYVTWGLNKVDVDLLKQVLASKDFRARAAGVRVIRYNYHMIPDHPAMLEKAATDLEGRVRLEAIVAASWLDNAVGKKVVALASAQPLDEWSKAAAKTASDRLAGVAETEVIEHPAPTPPAHLTDAEKKQFLAGHQIYFRDAHCATCHQPDGKGLAPAFPPLNDSPWVSQDPERLIKLTLHGLMGPFELHGKKYEGQVPMQAFGGMLKDDEVAAVLTYVRNNFGNKAPSIQPDQVKKVRDATKGRQTIYLVDELLKEHPMK